MNGRLFRLSLSFFLSLSGKVSARWSHRGMYKAFLRAESLSTAYNRSRSYARRYIASVGRAESCTLSETSDFALCASVARARVQLLLVRYNTSPPLRYDACCMYERGRARWNCPPTQKASLFDRDMGARGHLGCSSAAIKQELLSGSSRADELCAVNVSRTRKRQRASSCRPRRLRLA